MIDAKFRRVPRRIGGRRRHGFADGHCCCQIRVEAGIATGIRGDQHKAQIAFSRTIAAAVCVADAVRKDLNAILSRRLRAERSFDMHNIRVGSRRHCDHREVGLLIGPRVAVVRIIQRDTVAAQIDAQSGVGTNHIAEDRVSGCRRSDLNPRAAAEGDEVTGSGRGSADDVAG